MSLNELSPLGKGLGLSFAQTWNPSPNDVFCKDWDCVSGEENENVKSLLTDRLMDNRWSEKLTSAFWSGESKRAHNKDILRVKQKAYPDNAQKCCHFIKTWIRVIGGGDDTLPQNSPQYCLFPCPAASVLKL